MDIGSFQNSGMDIGAYQKPVAAGGLGIPLAMHHYKLLRR